MRRWLDHVLGQPDGGRYFRLARAVPGHPDEWLVNAHAQLAAALAAGYGWPAEITLDAPGAEEPERIYSV